MILDITDDMTHYRNDGKPFSKYTIPETAGNLLNNGTSFILVGPTMVSGSFNQDNDKRELVRLLVEAGFSLTSMEMNLLKSLTVFRELLPRHTPSDIILQILIGWSKTNRGDPCRQ